MTLSAKCTSCKKQIFLKKKAATRPDLSYKMGGDNFKLNCQNCGSMQKTHINDVRASEDMSFIALGLVIGLIFTAILWIFFGGVAVASMTIPLLMWRTQMASTHAFNKYLAQRH